MYALGVVVQLVLTGIVGLGFLGVFVAMLEENSKTQSIVNTTGMILVLWTVLNAMLIIVSKKYNNRFIKGMVDMFVNGVLTIFIISSIWIGFLGSLSWLFEMII